MTINMVHNKFLIKNILMGFSERKNLLYDLENVGRKEVFLMIKNLIFECNSFIT